MFPFIHPFFFTDESKMYDNVYYPFFFSRTKDETFVFQSFNFYLFICLNKILYIFLESYVFCIKISIISLRQQKESYEVRCKNSFGINSNYVSL